MSTSTAKRKKSAATKTRGQSEKAFRTAVANLSDEQLLKELSDAQREVGLLKSGREIVAMHDACNGAINLCDERMAALGKSKEELEAQIREIDQRSSIIASDRRALDRECGRLCKEIFCRFGGDWGKAAWDAPPGWNAPRGAER